MEKLTNFLTSPMTSKKVEQKGQGFINLGRLFGLIGVISFALWFISTVIALIAGNYFIDVLILEFDSDFAKVIFVICYLGTTIGFFGIPLYFTGLKLFTLGRIAVNTEGLKNNRPACDSTSTTPTDNTPVNYEELLNAGLISFEEYNALTSRI